MDWRLASRCMALSLLLTSCSHKIDEMRFRFDADRKGAFTASGSTTLSDTEIADIDNSSTASDVKLFQKKMDDCGFKTASYVKSNEMKLDVRAAFESPEELSSMIGCAPVSWKEFDISVERQQGVFYTTFITHFLMRQPRFHAADESGNVNAANITDVPRKLYFSVPGSVDDIANLSSIAGLKIDVQRRDEETVFVESTASVEAAKERANQLAEVQKKWTAGTVNAGNIAEQGTDQLEFKITSHENKFALQDILSVIGIIFGSGLLLELTRRVFRVRIEPRKEPPAS